MGLMQESRLSDCTHQSLHIYLRLRLGKIAKTSSKLPESPPTARSHQVISERASEKSTDSELLSVRSRGLNTLNTLPQWSRTRAWRYSVETRVPLESVLSQISLDVNLIISTVSNENSEMNQAKA